MEQVHAIMQAADAVDFPVIMQGSAEVREVMRASLSCVI